MSLMWHSSPCIPIVQGFSILIYLGDLHNLFIHYLLLFLLFASTIKHVLILLPYFQVLILSFMWFIMLARLSTQFFSLFFFRCIEIFISIFIPVWVFFNISMSLVNYFHVLNCCHYFIHQFIWVFLNSIRRYMLSSLNSFGCLFISSLNSLTSF